MAAGSPGPVVQPRYAAALGDDDPVWVMAETPGPRPEADPGPDREAARDETRSGQVVHQGDRRAPRRRRGHPGKPLSFHRRARPAAAARLRPGCIRRAPRPDERESRRPRGRLRDGARRESRPPRAPARGGVGPCRPARRAGRGVDPVHRGDVRGPRSHPPRPDRDDPDGALPEGREEARDAKAGEDERGRKPRSGADHSRVARAAQRAIGAAAGETKRDATPPEKNGRNRRERKKRLPAISRWRRRWARRRPVGVESSREETGERRGHGLAEEQRERHAGARVRVDDAGGVAHAEDVARERAVRAQVEPVRRSEDGSRERSQPLEIGGEGAGSCCASLGERVLRRKSARSCATPRVTRPRG